MTRKFILVLTILFFSIQSNAQESKEIAGTYITKGGWGHISISAIKENAISYEISTSGGNGSTSELSGQMQYDKSKSDFSDEGKKCSVDFKVLDNAITVSSRPAQECQMLVCGARATFNGVYIRVLPQCESKMRGNAKMIFLNLYKTGNYQAASKILEDLLSSCEIILDRQELGRIKNDLAITRYHLNDFTGCLQSLEPYLKDADLSDAEIMEKYGYDAVFADIQLGIVKSVRTNKKLCSDGLDHLQVPPKIH